MRWRVPVFLVLSLLLAYAAYVASQATMSTETTVPNFVNGIKLGSSGVMTGTAGTGQGSITLPANTIGFGTEISGFAEIVNFCGDLTNATTSYLGPGLAGLNGTPTDYVIGGAACSALDSTTEATADNPLSTLDTKVTGMRCKLSAAPGAGNSISFTLRANAANAITTDGGGTTVSCTISGATATECRTIAGTTTNILGNQPVAVAALPTYDASAQDARCVALVAWP